MNHLEAIHAIADGKKVTTVKMNQVGMNPEWYVHLGPESFQIEDNKGNKINTRFHPEETWIEFEVKKTIAQSQLEQVANSELSKTDLSQEEQQQIVSGIKSGLGF